MAQTVFVSPGVYTREQDFTFFASRIGITRLGLVGLSTKGPAFEPIKVASTDGFFARFGNTNPEYPLPYVAQGFLGQSSELTMTRVLGKTGFINTGAYVLHVTGGTYDNTTIAIIRSKKNSTTNLPFYSTSTGLTISSVTGMLDTFFIAGAPGTPLALNVAGSGLTVSLDETKKSYIVKALGTNPENVDGDYGLFVDVITPHWIRQQYSA